MRQLWLLGVLVTLLFTVTPHTIYGQACDVAKFDVNVSTTYTFDGANGYDAFNTDRVPLEVSFTVSNNNAGACNFFAFLSKGAHVSSGYNRYVVNAVNTKKIRYFPISTLNFATRNKLKTYNDAKFARHTVGSSVAFTGTRTFTFYVFLDPQKFVPGNASYTDDLTLTVFEGAFERQPPLNRKIGDFDFALSILSNPKTGFYISTPDIDFGELTRQETQNINFNYKSNVPVNILLQADNTKWNHKNFLYNNGRTSREYRVRYTLRDTESQQDLELNRNTFTQAFQLGKTNRSGRESSQLRLRIESVNNKVEGNYTDTLRVRLEQAL